jgi:hypothetical protein
MIVMGSTGHESHQCLFKLLAAVASQQIPLWLSYTAQIMSNMVESLAIKGKMSPRELADKSSCQLLVVIVECELHPP